MKRFDAHCHYSDDKIINCPSVVNGTSPDDWPNVLKLATSNAQVIPAIGLHPWKVNHAPADWQAQFLQLLPRAKAVGEIGLDQWIEGFDIAQQEAAFRWQLKQAAERNLPVSIHCLKAGAPLIRILKSSCLPSRGIHLHAYSGSPEELKILAELGAYFSFHAGQLRPNAEKVRAAICQVPADRLLLETDAPDTLHSGDDSQALLERGYEQVAELRGVSYEQLSKQVADNFQRYFQT